MTTIQLIVNILLVIAALALIVSVLLQKGDAEGIAALGGSSGAESFMGKNKARSVQGKLANITKVSAGLFVALAMLMIFLR
jgi:preprotein translocase subunit SecG